MEAGASDEEQNQQQQQKQSENLLLSFENPNYQFEKQLKSMDQARIDDHLNSNIEPNMYEELCKELKLYTELSGKSPKYFWAMYVRSPIRKIRVGILLHMYPFWFIW